jgi:hypothetical protein
MFRIYQGTAFVKVAHNATEYHKFIGMKNSKAQPFDREIDPKWYNVKIVCGGDERDRSKANAVN